MTDADLIAEARSIGCRDNLVQRLADRLERAAADEREACARIADGDVLTNSEHIAKAIRARG